MKISWGKKIAVLYIGFVVMMISLVTATAFNKPDLVAEDYYAQEIAFQQRLDALNAVRAMRVPPRVEKGADKVTILFPEEFRGKAVRGDVHFYAPSGSAADRKFPLAVRADRFEVSREALARVPYEVRISWTVSGRSFYQAQLIDLR